MTAAPLVGVLALQGDVREHELALLQGGARTQRVKTVEDLALVDALVIPGGESTTMSKLAVTCGLLEPLRERIRGGMPAFGSCAGMIMLAAEIKDGRADQQTFGGLDMVVRRNAFGRQVDSFEADVDLPEVASAPFHAVFIRAPWVESVGPDVQILGSIARDAAEDRIVAVRQGPLLATSFHPELTGDFRVHQYFLQMIVL